MPSRHRGFLFSYFIGKYTSFTPIIKIMDHIECAYMVYQKEKCPKTKRAHFQGYVYFSNAKTHTRVCKLFPGAHILVARKSAAINRKYCLKNETRIQGGRSRERGELPQQGVEGEIWNMMEDIREGLTNVEMFEKWGQKWHNSRGSLKEYRDERAPRRTKFTKCIVLYGATGLGKSSKAIWLAEKYGAYASLMVPQHANEKLWGEGLHFKKCIIVEDIEVPCTITYATMKNMIDHTEFRLTVKNGSMQWAVELLIITSEHHPSKWYGGYGGKWDPEINALCRRMTTRGSYIEHMTEEWHKPMPKAMVAEIEAINPFEDSAHSANSWNEYCMRQRHGEWDEGATIYVDSSDEDIEEVMAEIQPVNQFNI